MKIGMGSDHGGFTLKEELKKHLISAGHEVIDYGCNSIDSTDYPIYGKVVAKDISIGRLEYGILICTTGIGMSICANKYANVRAALVCNTDACYLTRKHNDSNILCIGAKYTTIEEAIAYTDIFLNTPFEGGRHLRRVEMIERK